MMHKTLKYICIVTKAFFNQNVSHATPSSEYQVSYFSFKTLFLKSHFLNLRGDRTILVNILGPSNVT